MGKHDIGEPINESLERHYQEQIKLRDDKIAEMKCAMQNALTEIDWLGFRLEEKDALIDELRSALVEQTLLATARKKG